MCSVCVCALYTHNYESCNASKHCHISITCNRASLMTTMYHRLQFIGLCSLPHPPPPNQCCYESHEIHKQAIHLPPTYTINTAVSLHRTTPTTLRSSALALCYSAAEYACPVWERSTHAKKLNATLNETCRMITGCLKPTNINSLPILAGIAPSDIRRAVASRTERTRQTMDERHPLNGHIGVVPRLKSRKSFIKCTEPITTTAKAVRLELWRERLEPLDASVHLNISAD